tara:strand:- start:531 stop:722 length:192 start_codon:yes stop_codon:yes gene_type:complete
VTRRFKPVPKVPGTKVPKKYVAGSKNKRLRMSELLATSKKYKEGTLTKAEMDRISKARGKDKA